MAKKVAIELTSIDTNAEISISKSPYKNVFS